MRGTKMSVPAFRRCGVPPVPCTVTGLPAAQPRCPDSASPMLRAQGRAGCFSISISMVLSTTWRSGLYFKAKESVNVEPFVPQTPQLLAQVPVLWKNMSATSFQLSLPIAIPPLGRWWGPVPRGAQQCLAGQGAWGEATARRSLAVPSSGCCRTETAASKEEGRKEDRKQRNKTFFITALDRYYIVL